MPRRHQGGGHVGPAGNVSSGLLPDRGFLHGSAGPGQGFQHGHEAPLPGAGQPRQSMAQTGVVRVDEPGQQMNVAAVRVA